MATREARLRALKKYGENHRKDYKIINIRLHKQHYSDLVAFLESKENVNGYIKDLIRADMEKTGGKK